MNTVITATAQASRTRIRSDGPFPKAPQSGIAAKRVLLVEDDAQLAEAIALLLEAFGYSVCASFGSGEDAIAEVFVLAPDIILMDINLEGIIDGIETAEIIAVKYTAPIIFMSADSDFQTRERASLFPHSGYLVKPFYPEALPIMIESKLRDFGASRERK